MIEGNVEEDPTTAVEEAEAPEVTPEAPDPTPPQKANDGNGDAPETSEVTPEELQTPPVTADSFDWEGWDGSMDAIPDDARAWAQRAREWEERRSKAELNGKFEQLDTLRERYYALNAQLEDPDLKTLREELEAKNKLLEEVSSNRDSLTAREKELVDQLEAEKNASTEQYTRLYRKAFDWIFDGGDNEKRAAEIFEEFGPDHLPDAMRLPAAQLQVAREELKKNPGAPNLAIKYAKSLSKKQPSDAALAVGGATSSQNVSPVVPKKVTTGLSVGDFLTRRARELLNQRK